MSTENLADRLGRIDDYVAHLFRSDDPALAEALAGMEENNLRRINISPNGGRLLYLLTRIAGARRVLEIGTLGGYSALWFARAVAPEGRVITLEADPRHARVARASIDRTELAGNVEVRSGDALGTMDAMIEGGEAPFDVIFIDANKDGYPRYLEAALQLSRPGTLILADNVIRDGEVIHPAAGEAEQRAVHQFNARLAEDPRLEAIILPTIGRGFVDGIALARVRPPS